jgi:hypothetical protein
MQCFREPVPPHFAPVIEEIGVVSLTTVTRTCHKGIATVVVVRRKLGLLNSSLTHLSPSYIYS